MYDSETVSFYCDKTDQCPRLNKNNSDTTACPRRPLCGANLVTAGSPVMFLAYTDQSYNRSTLSRVNHG